MHLPAIGSTALLALLGFINISTSQDLEIFTAAVVSRFEDRRCETLIDSVDLQTNRPLPGTTITPEFLFTDRLVGTIFLESVAEGCFVEIGGRGFSVDQFTGRPVSRV